jgi:hypothetical protein
VDTYLTPRLIEKILKLRLHRVLLIQVSTALQLAAIAAIYTFFLIPALSLGQDFRGSVVGTVMDSSGARIPSADVLLQATESSLERQTKSDNRGEFLGIGLPG